MFCAAPYAKQPSGLVTKIFVYLDLVVMVSWLKFLLVQECIETNSLLRMDYSTSVQTELIGFGFPSAKFPKIWQILGLFYFTHRIGFLTHDLESESKWSHTNQCIFKKIHLRASISEAHYDLFGNRLLPFPLPFYAHLSRFLKHTSM